MDIIQDIPAHLRDLKERLRLRRSRERELFNDPDLLDILGTYVGNGGTLIQLAELWDVSYGRIAQWINSDKERAKQMELSFKARGEWVQERILNELRMLAHVDIRLIMDDNGCVLPVSQWPTEVARAVEAMDVAEMFQGSGENRQVVGQSKKIKLAPKLKALELLGKTQAMFIERHEVKFKAMTLQELVDASWKEPEQIDVTPSTEEPRNDDVL